MQLSEVKYDCLFFRGHIPCKPNKVSGELCPNCTSYKKVSKKILIIKLGAMGDVIRTTPLLTKFNELYPDCHITWVTLTPDILPKGKIQQIYKWDETSVFVLQNAEFDIALNLDKEPEACMLLQKVKSKVKYGFSWGDGHIQPATEKATHKLLTGFFDSLSIANTKSYLEEIFEICHFEFQGEQYLMDVNSEFDQKWSELISKEAKGKKIIGLNTGAGDRWPTRFWQTESWEELIQKLQKADYFPVVLGGPAEDARNQIYAKNTGCYYPGVHPLKEFIAIANQMDTIVSAVSMMMHIAMALKKPLVLFNNIFNKHEFEMFNRGVIVEPDSGCECFYGNSCDRERHCMLDLSAQKVFDAVVEWSE